MGIPAFYVHAGECQHGDLGSVTTDDVVIAISYGGESDEIINVLPVLDQIGAQLMAITGKPHSTLWHHAGAVLDTGPDLGDGMSGWTHLFSIAASMAMGDALAIAAVLARGFTKQDFARYQPGFMLVKGPGGYRFRDYVRVGLLLGVILLGGTLTLLALLY